MPGNPLEKIDVVRDVQFVLKNGIVFMRGGVMLPAAYFHGGPVNGYARGAPRSATNAESSPL